MNDRERMVRHGVVQVAQRGVGVCLEAVSLDEAAFASGLAATTAAEVWSGAGGGRTPEDSFRDAVAARVLREQPEHGDTSESGGLTETLEAVGAALEEMPGLDELTPEQRALWVRRVIRIATDRSLHATDSSRLWPAYVAITAGLWSATQTRNELAAAWRDGEGRGASRYASFYQLMADMFGMSIRPQYTWEQFTTAVSALGDGLVIRAEMGPEVLEIERPTGPGGEDEQWSLFGVGVEALARQFLDLGDMNLDPGV